MRVVGIDAGYVNFSFCSVSSSDILRPLCWSNEALFTGKFSEERLAEEIYRWVTKPEVKDMLDRADKIVLERQMVKKFQAVNHCIRFRYFEKTVELNPNTVGKYFKLPLERAPKKKAAVELVGSNLPFPVRKGKKDDLADSYLLAAYVIFQEYPQLKEGWKDGFISGESRKRKRSSKTSKISTTNRRSSVVESPRLLDLISEPISATGGAAFTFGY